MGMSRGDLYILVIRIIVKVCKNGPSIINSRSKITRILNVVKLF